MRLEPHCRAVAAPPDGRRSATADGKPKTVEMPQQITLDTELIDEICLENEKSSQRMRGQ